MWYIKKIIDKKRLLFIVLAAFLTTALLTVLVNLDNLTEENQKSITVMSQDGVYDLTDISDLGKTEIKLPPETVYYPNTYLMPESVQTALPEGIDRFEEIRADYLSQRFVLKLPESKEVYTMTLKLSGRHAMRVYVNGTLTAQAGQPDTVKEDTVVWENNITFHGAAENGEIEVILHSAQFYHARKGASLAELRLGKAETDPFLLERIKGVAVAGALLCAAVLLMGIYLLMSRMRATLYFALACMVMALREFLQSQVWTYFSIPGNLSFMLEYLSLALLTVLLTLYLAQYAEGKFLRAVQYTAIAGSLLYGGCVLLADSLFYTSILFYYQALLVLTIVPSISVLFWKMRSPTREQATAMYGIGVFFMAALFDIVMYSDILGDIKINTPVSELAMLVFMVAQTISQFQMNNQVLLETKQAEQKLEAEKTALESLNQLKTQFLSNTSHEMRTPLTVISVNIQTAAEILEDIEKTVKDTEATELLQSAQQEIMRLSRMVGGMLNLASMSENTDKQAVNLSKLLRSSGEMFSLHLEKRGNLLKMDIADGLNVFGNADLLTQVMANLLQNAAVHTEQGEITLLAENRGPEILVTVTDTGRGISADLLPLVFERGVSTGGTGFGLYLCKTVVESHGGRIWIESTQGRGTRATFALPTYEGQFGGETHE